VSVLPHVHIETRILSDQLSQLLHISTQDSSLMIVLENKKKEEKELQVLQVFVISLPQPARQTFYKRKGAVS